MAVGTCARVVLGSPNHRTFSTCRKARVVVASPRDRDRIDRIRRPRVLRVRLPPKAVASGGIGAVYVLGCGVAVSAATLVSTYKGGTAELHLAAQRYENVAYGMDRQSVASLFEGSRINPAEFGTRGPEELVDTVDNFSGGFGDVVIVYYREGRVVGKCLHFRNDPRPNFPPVHPSSPPEEQPCY